ncbi:hypothetical protein [Phaeobacter sp. 22II1-1F12B]|uniref:hypothetical protein n=1 Tax=Phaeobacter sp. 22II1-1F12B TaxID=1317111 RepID=UPI000B526EE5|nr:hypothetical protein [Phaeobacter sp. 22II1-1F12B]OWU76229.1 hypothetical protein ATO1_16280 [Phaeobacter sp. 22II1-1F12B]
MSIVRTGRLRDKPDFPCTHPYGNSYIMPFAIDFTTINGAPRGGVASGDIAGLDKLCGQGVNDLFGGREGGDRLIVDFLIHNLHPNLHESHFLFAT